MNISAHSTGRYCLSKWRRNHICNRNGGPLSIPLVFYSIIPKTDRPDRCLIVSEQMPDRPGIDLRTCAWAVWYFSPEWCRLQQLPNYHMAKESIVIGWNVRFLWTVIWYGDMWMAENDWHSLQSFKLNYIFLHYVLNFWKPINLWRLCVVFISIYVILHIRNSVVYIRGLTCAVEDHSLKGSVFSDEVKVLILDFFFNHYLVIFCLWNNDLKYCKSEWIFENEVKRHILETLDIVPIGKHEIGILQ